MDNLQEALGVSKKYDLRKIEEVPEPYRGIFAGYPHFNFIQSGVYNNIFYSDEPVVVSAPTGSGKTVIFELAIVRLLLNWEVNTMKDYKIIYISPTKALCEERLVDWHKKFTQFGVSCISVTGDTPSVDISILTNSKLIITTPEKWDSLTRRWRDDERVVRSIKLFMIDEIHLLNDETRGPTLEAIITRMKTIHSSYQMGATRTSADDGIRLVGVSATISNVVDIAEWFGVSGKPAKYFKFEESMRPVKLTKIVQGYPYNPSVSTPFKFDIMLSFKLHNVLLQHSSGKPTLIFCSTRKSVEMTCKQLIQNLTIDLSPERKQILIQAANSLDDPKMKETLIHGVACHHAGMLPQNRRSIETLFREGNLPVLVTTSTLAMGVNLPAHLVVIKSTKYYGNAGYRDYSESMLFQMIGRAGRPQFDTSAVAVIMTTAADKSKYENMISGEQPVESYLHKSLAEHINAEVVLRTITDLTIAMQWLSSTFFYIRARKNPKNYSLPVGLSQTQLDKRLLVICQIEINKLAKVGMLTIDQNVVILPTRTGSLMAKYCAALQTMKLFTEVTGKEVLQQVLDLISKCREFSEIRLRTDDKRPLNILNDNRGQKTIRFPLNGRIKTLDMKINCIIQAVLGSLEISASSLMIEAQRIMVVGERLLNCLSEYLENKEDCYKTLHSSLTLSKCFHARIWENSSYVSRQLEGIGVCFSNSLVESGKTTFKEILNSNPRDLERILNKKPPFGNKIQDQVRILPQYDLAVKEVILEDGKVTVEVTVILENRDVFENDITVNPGSIMSLLVGDSENNVLLHERYTHLYMIENVKVLKSVEVKTCFEHEIFISFISDSWVGIDAHKSIKLFTTEEVPGENRTVQSISDGTVQELPDSTNGNIKSSVKIKKFDKNRKSLMLQQVMDQYFKKVKTPKRENRALRRRCSGQIKRKASATKIPDRKPEDVEETPTLETNTRSVSPEENGDTMSNSNNKLKENFENDEAQKESVLSENKDTMSNSNNKLEENFENNEAQKENVSDIVNSSINVYKQKSNFKLSDEKEKENDLVPSTPYSSSKLHQNRTFRANTKSIVKQCRRNRDNMRTFELESVAYEESKVNSDLSQFVKDPKRKLENVNAYGNKKVCIEKSTEEVDNSVKSLTWSSPLVISPKIKYSPYLNSTLTHSETDGKDIRRKLPSLKNNAKIFSISDKECFPGSENNNLKYSDVFSQSLLDSLRLKSEAVRQDSAQCIPSITSEPETSKITRCVPGSENQNLKYADVFSQSLLDSLGIKSEVVRQDTAQCIPSVTSEQEPSKVIRCDPNQTSSSISSESTNTSVVPKSKTINSSTYYAQILRQTSESKQTQTNCVASQVEDFILNDQNYGKPNNNDSKDSKEIGNQEHCNVIDIINTIPEKIMNSPKTAASKLHQDEQTLDSCQSSIKRVNSWEEEFLSDEPAFECISNIQQGYSGDLLTEKRNVDISKNLIGNYKPNLSMVQTKFSKPRDTQTKQVNIDKRILQTPPNRITEEAHKEPKIKNTNYEFTKNFHNNEASHASNWMSESDVNRKDMNISYMKNRDYRESNERAFDTTFTYEDFPSKYSQPCTTTVNNSHVAMMPFKNSTCHYQPFHLENNEPRNIYDRMRSHTERHNMEQTNKCGNLNYFSDIAQKNKDCCDSFQQQVCCVRDQRNHALSNDFYSMPPNYAHNTILSGMGTGIPGNFVGRGEANLRRADTDFSPDDILNNSFVLSQTTTPPFYDISNQNTYPHHTTSSEYFPRFNEKSNHRDHNVITNRSQYFDYDNIHNAAHLRNIDGKPCSSKYDERDYICDANEKQMRTRGSIQNQYLPNFIYPNATENMMYSNNYYDNCGCKRPIKNPDPRFHLEHMEAPCQDNNNRNFQHVSYRSSNSPQYSTNLGLNTRNKNDFLLSRYFHPYPKPTIPNFDQELLNLNHTITSDYMRNVPHHF